MGFMNLPIELQMHVITSAASFRFVIKLSPGVTTQKEAAFMLFQLNDPSVVLEKRSTKRVTEHPRNEKK
jgi:hypothetical protein